MVCMALLFGVCIDIVVACGVTVSPPSAHHRETQAGYQVGDDIKA